MLELMDWRRQILARALPVVSDVFVGTNVCCAVQCNFVYYSIHVHCTIQH